MLLMVPMYTWSPGILCYGEACLDNILSVVEHPINLQAVDLVVRYRRHLPLLDLDHAALFGYWIVQSTQFLLLRPYMTANPVAPKVAPRTIRRPPLDLGDRNYSKKLPWI